MPEAISDIKLKLSQTHISDILTLIDYYQNDSRKGVIKIVESYRKKYSDYLSELKRLDDMSVFEKKYYDKDIKLIAGVDEVGRGPLAGPVVTASVILPENCRIQGINDSKKLSAKKRTELADIIKKEAVSYSIGIMSNIVIDEINILQATIKAMQMAVSGLSVKPQCVLVDALEIPEIDIPQESIIKGDEKSISIAAASIVAKVTRDEMMIKLSELYPEYYFHDNKGYGSQKHIEAIKKYGLSPIHRLSFTKNICKCSEGYDVNES